MAPGNEFLDNSTLLPISSVMDISKIETLDPKSKEFKAFLTSLTENVNNILLSVNAKDIGIYDSNETLAGQSYFDADRQDQRPVYRKVIDFGALKNAAGTTTAAHGLDAAWEYKFTRIYGATSDPTAKVYLPLPYSSATAADVIEVYIDSTNVNIQVGKDRSSYTTTYIVIEYLEF